MIDIPDLEKGVHPRMAVNSRITYADGRVAQMPLMARIDTADEVAYFTNGGILPYVLRHLLAA